MHLWTESEGSWFVTPLAADRGYTLELDAHRHLRLRALSAAGSGAGCERDESAAGDGETGATGAARLVADAGSWVLLVPHGAAVTVDGARVSAGARVLRDRAELLVEGSLRAFFGSEELARIEPAPAANNGSALICPRCQTPIRPGSASVRCVGCSVFYHQQDGDEELLCYSYAPSCGLCSHETSLDGAFGWTPQDAGFGSACEEGRP